MQFLNRARTYSTTQWIHVECHLSIKLKASFFVAHNTHKTVTTAAWINCTFRSKLNFNFYCLGHPYLSWTAVCKQWNWRSDWFSEWIYGKSLHLYQCFPTGLWEGLQGSRHQGKSFWVPLYSQRHLPIEACPLLAPKTSLFWSHCNHLTTSQAVELWMPDVWSTGSSRCHSHSYFAAVGPGIVRWPTSCSQHQAHPWT